MNKGDDFQRQAEFSSKTATGPSGPASRKSGQVRGRRGGLKTKVEGIPLSRQAERLLAALNEADAQARVDACDEASVVVSRVKSGLSISAGRFPLAEADALMCHDLVAWKPGAARQRALHITQAGRAYLRRRSAHPSEDPFQVQHQVLEEAEVILPEGLSRVRVNTDESPLGWLRRRKGRDGEPMIDEASYQAGERLRLDITLAGLLPGMTSTWGVPKVDGGSAPGNATDSMVAARQRLAHAFAAVGSDFGNLLMDLCGFLKGLELIERERQWPPRSGKVVARLALARLAEHYGLETAARGPSASRGIRSWTAIVIEGGRPEKEGNGA